jgi:hypothetical protein
MSGAERVRRQRRGEEGKAKEESQAAGVNKGERDERGQGLWLRASPNQALQRSRRSAIHMVVGETVRRPGKRSC